MHTLQHLRIVDLHGNSKRGETAGGDENVFEITEGVAIAVGIAQPGLAQRVEHADLTGPRQAKYESLMANGLHLLAPMVPSGQRLQLVRSRRQVWRNMNSAGRCRHYFQFAIPGW